jgi:hypothetical protein
MIKEFQGKYRWLSNFWTVKVILEGTEYKSVEHAFQSAKSDDPNWKLYCKNTERAGEIKKLSRSVKLIKDWDTKKILIMKELLVQKFNKEPYKSMLIETGNQEIQEGNLWHDTFWGIDLRTGNGNNLLGKMIMEIRDNF